MNITSKNFKPKISLLYNMFIENLKLHLFTRKKKLVHIKLKQPLMFNFGVSKKSKSANY